MKTKLKLSLILWAAAGLFLSCWSVGFAMSGMFYGNGKVLTFSIALWASLTSAVCGAGFMQQWMKK
jgi:hypothetical protein